jgi:hypothetical protein
MKLLGISELIISIKRILNNKFDYLFLFFQLVVFTGLVKQVSSDTFLIVNLIISVVLVLFKKRKIFKPLLFYVIFLYLLIILTPVMLYGFNKVLYIGFFIRLLTGYFIILYFKRAFISYFENIVFVLAFISLPLYIIQIISKDFYNIFERLSNALLIPGYMELGDFRYLLIFLINPGGLTRNSGFMWEPAAFGGTLAWAMLFNLFINKFKPNNRLSIFIIAALTTFSVGTYIYLFFISILYFYENRLKKAFILIIPFAILLIIISTNPFFQDQFNMMSGKIMKEPENVEEAVSGNVKSYQVSRYAGIYINVAFFLKNPLGYGFPNEKREEFKLLASSPNGLMHILVRWGIIGISIFVFCVIRLIYFLKGSYFPDIKKISVFLSVLVFILPFTGNPFYHRPLMFSFLFLPFLFNRKFIINVIFNAKAHSKNNQKSRDRHYPIPRSDNEKAS